MKAFLIWFSALLGGGTAQASAAVARHHREAMLRTLRESGAVTYECARGHFEWSRLPGATERDLRIKHNAECSSRLPVYGREADGG